MLFSIAAGQLLRLQGQLSYFFRKLVAMWVGKIFNFDLVLKIVVELLFN